MSQALLMIFTYALILFSCFFVFFVARKFVSKRTLIGVSGLLQLAFAGSVDARPNVVFILADDHQAGLIHAMGQPAIQTPNLDRLVAQGMTFTNAHAEIPSCQPSRATILTGTSGFTHKTMHPNYSAGMDRSLLPFTWLRAMQTVGYETVWVGKWNAWGKPEQWGVDVVRCLFSAGMGSHQLKLKDPDGTTYEGFSSTMFADAAIGYIEARPEKPFFLTLSFTAPHDPRTPPQEFKDMYPPETMIVPENFMPEHPFDDGYLTIRDEKLLPRPRTKEAIRKELADYYGMISQMDQQIGRVIDALEASGQLENTLLIYCGDHGLALGQHGLLGKFSMYEHSVRTPLLIAGPGIPNAQQSDALVYLHDLYPTVCEMAGAEIPETVESSSLLPVIEGREAKVRDLIFCANSNRQRMVRSDRYKLIRFYRDETKQWGTNRILFFDLENDPLELNDLSGNPEYQELIQRYSESLANWQAERGDFLIDSHKQHEASQK